MVDIRKELIGKTIAVWDYETDGFLETMTQVHCGVICDAYNEDSAMEYCLGAEGKIALDALDKFEVLVGHNIIGYDLPMVKQMYGWEPRKEVIIIDTLFLSRLYNPDLEGGHSLGSWGERLKEPKTSYHPVTDELQPVYNPDEKFPSKNPCWTGSIYTENMGSYCKQDVIVNTRTFWKLLDLTKNFSWLSITCEMVTATIIQRQMQHGFVFKKEEAEKLLALLTSKVIALEEEVHRTFKPIAKLIKVVQPKVKMDNTISSVGLGKILNWEDVICVPNVTRSETVVTRETYNQFTETTEKRDVIVKNVEYHTGSFSLIEWPDFSLGSRQQIAERLLQAKYKLTKKTEKGNFIIDDEVLQVAADAGIPEAKPLAEYFMLTKREGMVKDWIKRAVYHEEQGVWRMHGRVNTLGAISNRMTHNSPNVAQVPSPKSKYGKECRSLFGCRRGYKLVGCDASGLELRCLAHYMNDPVYTKELLEGDIHTANQVAAGLPDRNSAKTFIYGFLYGGGDAKIGQIVGGNAKIGKKLKEQFLNSTPALKKLRDGILHVTSFRKWLKGLDGRIIRVRSSHSALNSLLQGAGAIVCKHWLIEFMSQLDKAGIYAEPCANIHDEANVEVLEKDAEQVAKIMEQAFLTVTKTLKSNCLLEGEAKIGNTWYEVH